jgi:hypothetical protein
MLYFKGEKVRICGFAEVLSPQITKNIGSANQESVTFAEGPQIYQII